MVEVLIGLAALVGLLTLLRLFIGADARALAKVVRYVGATLLLAIALFLFLGDRVVAALFLVTIAWGLFTGGRVWPDGWPHYRSIGGAQDEKRASNSTMSRAEALKVLGLEEGASEDDIRAAHKKLMMQNHPDRGGSDYLASKINEAKDILLGD